MVIPSIEERQIGSVPEFKLQTSCSKNMAGTSCLSRLNISRAKLAKDSDLHIHSTSLEVENKSELIRERMYQDMSRFQFKVLFKQNSALTALLMEK